MTRKRILFIDGDDGFVREVAGAAEQRGFESVVTASSNDGFDLARANRPDLIVVNVELLPTNGWSVCTKLKKDDELKDIPVVLTSSTSTEDTFEKHKKLKTRADDYLLKPYSSDDLVRVAGGLVGLPDDGFETLHSSDEALVVEDEALTLGEFDAGTLDETITVAEDEPLALLDEGEPLAALGEEPLDDAMLTSEELQSEELPSEEFSAEGAFDPLAAIAGGEEPVISDEAALAAASLPGESGLDELAAFDESFASLTPPPQPVEDPSESAVADPLAGEETFADLGAEEAPVTFEEEALGFDEAPLEVPSEDDVTTVSEPPFETSDATASADLSGSEFAEGDAFGGESMEGTGDGALSLGSLDDSPRLIELESRVAELEAELEGYRQTESGRDQEIERLREELNERERTLSALRESDSRLQSEAARARDEKARREATMKALTTKAEQTALAAKKLERDLLAAREEAKGGQALKAKVAELEQAKKDGEHARAELDQARAQIASLQQELEQAQSEAADLRREGEELRAQLAQTQADHAHTQTELDLARSEADGLRGDVEEARASAEKALASAGQLQERVAESEQKARSSEESLKRLRGQLLSVLEEMGESAA